MRTHKLALAILCAFALFLSVHQTATFGAEAPVDFQQLGLKIVKAARVPKISVSDPQTRLTPKAGFQLVVVDIQGKVDKSTKIKLKPSDFIAATSATKTRAKAVAFRGTWYGSLSSPWF